MYDKNLEKKTEWRPKIHNVSKMTDFVTGGM